MRVIFRFRGVPHYGGGKEWGWGCRGELWDGYKINVERLVGQGKEGLKKKYTTLSKSTEDLKGCQLVKSQEVFWGLGFGIEWSKWVWWIKMGFSWRRINSVLVSGLESWRLTVMVAWKAERASFEVSRNDVLSWWLRTILPLLSFSTILTPFITHSYPILKLIGGSSDPCLWLVQCSQCGRQSEKTGQLAMFNGVSNSNCFWFLLQFQL